MKNYLVFCLSVLITLSTLPLLAEGSNASAPINTLIASSSLSSSGVEAALTKAAQDNKFVFLLVQDKQDEPTAAARKTVEATAQKLADKAVWFELDRNKTTEKATIEKYELLRAPTPLVLVIAPNGAVTAGLVGDKATSEKLGEALVSSGLQRIIKAMQSQKLVLLCVQNKSTKSNEAAMKGVNDFKADARFGNDVEIIQIDPSDTNEEKVLAQLKIDSKTTEAITTLLAPPGAALATFSGATTKDQIETALKPPAGACGPSGCGPSGCN